MPREGQHASSPSIGDLVRQDVPVCHLGDRVGAVVARLQTAGWDQCIVVNRENIVLGLLHGEALHAEPKAAVELAMQPGPTTVRPDRSLGDIREYMRQHGAASVVVTTPKGQLIGVVKRADVDHRLASFRQGQTETSPRSSASGRLEIGYKLSCEEHGPKDLVHYAKEAEDAGFTFAMLSDHYHPWISEQGQSPFVWSVIGGIAQVTKRLQIGTGVTCPLLRIHPSIIAQAAATAAAMLPGRFLLGVGTGENLNEHIGGAYWPPAATRRDMLEEAIEILRLLWQGGLQGYEGQYYEVESAQLYTLPEQPPPLLIAASGRRSAQLAGRIGDGLITVGVAADLVDRFTAAGGAEKPRYAELTVCWAADEAMARRLAHARWPIAGMQGALLSDLRLPSHFAQAATSISEEDVAQSVVCGPDPARHVAVHEAEHVMVWAPRPDTPPELSRSIAMRNALLLLLACAARGVDATSYLRLGHVFTANMTGNTVLLGLALSQAESHAIIRSSCALAGFLTGGALGAGVAHRGHHDAVWPLPVTFVLLLVHHAIKEGSKSPTVYTLPQAFDPLFAVRST